MARSDRVLAIDIGATSIKVGEFEYPTRETPTLVNFAIREYEEELTESTRSVVVAGLLRQMLVENSFQSRRALISMSGQSAFTRFVKLPPFAEDEKRIRQIVEFEAKQNVPFNMDEVIWDYQLIASPDDEEMDVMFVVIKNEIVEQMTGAVQAVGLEPLLVDVAPAACYNAARANHVGEEECTMVLNIGGRSTNLLFVDRSRFFARTIPIAGHTITQQVAKEFGIGFAEAEELKRRHGFVALGGAYAEPESEVAANVSKIIRNVMARLHGEINRSISVYRAQQHGNRPTRMVLTGGSSTLTYCDHFFAEKLHLEVSYFNPFQVVALGPAVDRQRLQEVAHMFSEVIGLGLRYRLPCPIEVTLVPETIRRQQALRRKKPFVFAAMACLVVILLVAWFAQLNQARLYSRAVDTVVQQREGVEGFATRIRGYTGETDQRKRQVAAITDLLRQRRRWPDLYNELYRLKPDNLWFHSIRPVIGEITPAVRASPSRGGGGGSPMEGGGMMGGGMMGGGGFPGGMMGPGGGGGFPGGMMGPGGGEGGGGFPGGMMGPGGAEGAEGAGGGMMGPGGGGMGMGVSQSVASYSLQPVSGLIISGHGVLLGTADAAEAIRAAAAAAEGGTAADAEAGAENAPDEETPERRRAKAIERAAKQPTPELAFLELLRASDLFDPDKEYTEIVSYTPPQNVDNLSTFTIQIKLKEPFEFNQFGR
jgi:type IV pilus assembly protein PilM